MAVGTVTGAFFGSRNGIQYGARRIRPFFVAVAVVLLTKMALDTFV